MMIHIAPEWVLAMFILLAGGVSLGIWGSIVEQDLPETARIMQKAGLFLCFCGLGVFLGVAILALFMTSGEGWA